MLLLALETSCDDTCSAVLENGTRVLSNVVASQNILHAKTGGVVPEVASREHAVKIAPTIALALQKAGVTLREIDALAVTVGPGLVSSLLVGVTAGNALALATGKPLFAVHHITAHLASNFLERDILQGHVHPRVNSGVNYKKILQSHTSPRTSSGIDCKKIFSQPLPRDLITLKFPAVVLTASGGHNEIILWQSPTRASVLGETCDDAAGEAFDKAARALGLGFPGGPAIERAAKKGQAKKYPFPRAWLNINSSQKEKWDGRSLDFSFSGVKSELVRRVKQLAIKNWPKEVADLSAGFEEAVTEVLAVKLLGAAERFKARQIHLAGGVSANLKLRQKVLSRARVPVLWPVKKEYCTDNAAMAAAAAFQNFKKFGWPKKFVPLSPEPRLKLFF